MIPDFAQTKFHRYEILISKKKAAVEIATSEEEALDQYLKSLGFSTESFDEIFSTQDWRSCYQVQLETN